MTARKIVTLSKGSNGALKMGIPKQFHNMFRGSPYVEIQEQQGRLVIAPVRQP